MVGSSELEPEPPAFSVPGLANKGGTHNTQKEFFIFVYTFFKLLPIQWTMRVARVACSSTHRPRLFGVQCCGAGRSLNILTGAGLKVRPSL